MSAKNNKWKRKFKRLQAVVTTLYVSASWEADRYVEDERELWAELRDAAGIETGTKTSILRDTVKPFGKRFPPHRTPEPFVKLEQG